MDDNSPTTILAEIPAATAYEAAGKCGDVAPDIRLMTPGLKLAGPALTVRCMPGDMTAVVRAIDQSKPGDVLVIDAGGTSRSTIFGGTSAIAAKTRGIAGVVTNGAVRDVDELIELELPVFAKTASVRGTVKSHAGWLNLPIALGDAVIAPGDYLIGDSDGVVVLPATRLEEITANARTQRRNELEKDSRARAGEPLARIIGID